MLRDRRHTLFGFQCVARINDHHLGNRAHHRQIFGGLVARAVAGGQARQRCADLHVEVFFCDHLVNEIVGASCSEHCIGRGERDEPLLCHTTSRSHQQLLSHAHLQKSLRVFLGEDM
ncbi:hypothetical protein D3C76_1397380 [compost metagenome]